MAECHFCEENQTTLDTHRVIPGRFGGKYTDANTVSVCPTCHRKLETMYNDTFYDAIGAERPNSGTGQECGMRECGSHDTVELTGHHQTAHVCDRHKRCMVPVADVMILRKCGARSVLPVPIKNTDSLLLVCDDHRVCGHEGCSSKKVVGFERTLMGNTVVSNFRCSKHTKAIESAEE